MSTVLRTTNAQVHPSPKSLRSVDLVTEPLRDIATGSTSLVVCESGRWDSEGRSWTVPQFIFLGPTGGVEPLRIGLFAGIHGDELAAIFALVRFARLLEANPEIARGFTLFLYPVCNPTGFEANTRENRDGKDLNREFWRNSTEPEIRILESELRLRGFDGIIALHTDDTSDGAYGYARGPVITQHLLRPALQAAAVFVPLNEDEVIDGFSARGGIIRESFEGVLRAPPGIRPRPFEMILETPQRAPQFVQECAFAAALGTVLDEYRRLIAYAENL